MTAPRSHELLGPARRDVLALGLGAAALAMLPGVTALARSTATRTLLPEKTRAMTTVTTRDGVEIFYKDWGPRDAQPIVFHRGSPLSADDWDTQMLFFLANG